MSAANMILLKGDANRYEEGVAGGTITPGMAVEIQSDETIKQPASTSAEYAKGRLAIALEDALQGKTRTDNYAEDDIVFFTYPLPGDQVDALVKSGEDINIGDVLVAEGSGSGLFVKAAGTESKYQLKALEDSGGALTANGYIRCLVL